MDGVIVVYSADRHDCLVGRTIFEGQQALVLFAPMGTSHVLLCAQVQKRLTEPELVMVKRALGLSRPEPASELVRAAGQ